MAGKLVKFTIGGVAAILILIIIVISAALYSIDALAKGAIEKGGTYALGVETKLDDANIRLLSGKFGLTGLSIHNPEGFKDPYFLELGDGRVAITLKSVTEERVELPELTLDDVSVTLIKQSGGSNYGVILENIEKRTGGKDGTKDDKPAEPKAEGKKKTFVIRQVNINNVNVKADLVGGGELTSVSMKIDNINLQDVGEKDPNVTIDKLMSILIQALISGILEKGTGILPDDIMGGLKSGMSELQSLGDMGISVSSGAAEQLQNLSKNVGDVGKNVGGEVGGAIEDAAEGIGGLFGGKKKDDDKKSDEKKDDEKKNNDSGSDEDF